MISKQQHDEILIKPAAERLHVDRSSVLRMINRGALNARLVAEAPRPYYLILIDDKFLAEEKARNQSSN